MDAKEKKPRNATNVFKDVRHTLREHALETVTLPSTGRKLVAFEGMPWVGVLEIDTDENGERRGTWRNVEVLVPWK